jgi:hypothetical protein
MPAANSLSTLTCQQVAGDTCNGHLTGTSLTPEATVAVSRAGLRSTRSLFPMPQINVILTIAADAVSGTRDVTVTTSAGNINAFQVSPRPANPESECHRIISV